MIYLEHAEHSLPTSGISTWIRSVQKFCSLKYGFVYIVIAKSASQSLVRVFSNAHADDPDSFFLSRAPLDELLESDPRLRGFYRFSFVRHPFTRLVSCYINKVVNMNEATQRMMYKAGLTEPPESFEAFVDFVCSPAGSDVFANDHWASQYACLAGANGGLLVEAVGKVETIGEDLAEVLKKFEIKKPGKMPHKNRRTLPDDKETSPRLDDSFYWSPEIDAKIRARYAEDYHRFGYLPGLP